MNDELFLLEFSKNSERSKPKWDSDADYEGLRRAVSMVEASESAILSDSDSRAMAKMRYSSYISDHYVPTRRHLALIGWRRGDVYPDSISPYYVWRDCHMEIAWAYLRRSPNYKTYFSRYMRTLNSFFPQIALHVMKNVGDSDSNSTAYSRFLHYYNVKMNLHEAWRNLSASREYKAFFERDYLKECGIQSNADIIYSSECRAYEIFRLSPHFGLTHPGCEIPPIFLQYTKPVKIVSVKRLFHEEMHCYEEEVFSKFEPGVTIAFRLDENIEDQLLDAKAKIEGLCKNMDIGFSCDIENERRPRLGKHEEYIRLIDAKDDGVTSPKQIGPVLYKGLDALDIGKRLEKAMYAAEEILLHGYYEIATLPFRK